MTVLRGGYVLADNCESMKPGSVALMSFVLGRFGEMANGGICNCRRIAGSNQYSIHAECRALDIMTGTGNPTRNSKWLAEQMRVYSGELGIQGIIHNRKAWWSNGSRGWVAYNGSNPHVNHIHGELTPSSAVHLTTTAARRILVGPSISGSINRGSVLRQGSRGSVVSYTQARLRAHGYGIKADGVYGPATVSAVRSFQRLCGLSVDGLTGPVTWGRLQ